MRPDNWIDLVRELGTKRIGYVPFQLCSITLEAHDWNIEDAEICLKRQGWGGHA